MKKTFIDGSKAPNSPGAQAQRFAELLKQSKLSLKQLEKMLETSSSTIQSWKEGEKNGLTPTEAKTIVSVFQKEGIDCDAKWLLSGEGNPPQINNAATRNP